ncbi:MAG: hypothetical protein M1829_001090 [Trizodia sp. TS-e1964]|nr:MAG: hypothetical protein M1829_001090 [Trizodia sp. TS-e1964]
MGVKGFPTLKIIKPGKKAGNPVVEDYQGARTAKGIADAVIEKMPNHVKRIGDKSLDGWLKEGNDTPKAILFTNKGITSALIKALSVDFLGGIHFAQIRDKETASVARFGIKTYPTLILLPGGDQQPVTYEGEMKKTPIVEFLSQVHAPNPEAIWSGKVEAKDSSKKEFKKTNKKAPKDAKEEKQPTLEEIKEAFNKQAREKLQQQKPLKQEKPKANTPSSQASSDEKFTESEPDADETIILGGDDAIPTPSASEESSPSATPTAETFPAITSLALQSELNQLCLGAKASPCILALLPPVENPGSILALSSLAELAQKHSRRKSHLFPFYAIPASNAGNAIVQEALGLKSVESTEIVVINARRRWWRRFTGSDYGYLALESFVDEIRLGEGAKTKLPESLVTQAEGKPITEKHDEL